MFGRELCERLLADVRIQDHDDPIGDYDDMERRPSLGRKPTVQHHGVSVKLRWRQVAVKKVERCLARADRYPPPYAYDLSCTHLPWTQIAGGTSLPYTELRDIVCHRHIEDHGYRDCEPYHPATIQSLSTPRSASLVRHSTLSIQIIPYHLFSNIRGIADGRVSSGFTVSAPLPAFSSRPIGVVRAWAVTRITTDRGLNDLLLNVLIIICKYF